MANKDSLSWEVLFRLLIKVSGGTSISGCPTLNISDQALPQFINCDDNNQSLFYRELREDGTIELREDNGYELREN
jgi:hypothetical protein